jgi:hypothetical protein
MKSDKILSTEYNEAKSFLKEHSFSNSALNSFFLNYHFKSKLFGVLEVSEVVVSVKTAPFKNHNVLKKY